VDHNELVLEERRLAYRAARLAFITAIIGLVSFAAHEIVGYLKYVHKEKEIERRAAQEIQLTDPSVSPPYVDARSRGADLEFEAGLDLRIIAEKNPDGTGSLLSTVTDYPPGKYRLHDAPNAGAVLAVLNGGVSDFITTRFQGLEIEVEAVGGADGIPVKPGAYYKGDLGPIRDAEYYSYGQNERRRIELIPNQTKLSNDAIGFLRAYEMLSHLVLIPGLQNARQKIGVDLTNRIGGEYRRVLVKVVLVNALRDEYQELGPVAKRLVF
jgi:hypothetical protein